MVAIAYDARPLEPGTRHWGIGTFVENVVRRLGDDFRCRGIAGAFEPPMDLEIRCWPRLRRTQRAFFELSPWLAPHDVYWGTTHWLPQVVRRPTALTVHDMLLLSGLEARDQFGAWRFVSSLRRADRIIANSATTADELCKSFPQLRTKVTVVLHGLAQTRLELAPRDRAVDAGYLLMLGCHQPRKNLRFALDVVARARDAGLALSLRIAGNVHPTFEPLLSPAPAWVERLGVVSRARVEELLVGAAALAYPSRYEGFGLPILEAMAAGCPVLALDTAINREIGGGAALLSNEPERWVRWLREMASSWTLRREVQERGIDNAARFSWDKTAAGYREILRGLAL